MPVIIPGPGQDVLPASDQELLAWAVNYIGIYDPATFGTTVPAIAYFASELTAYNDALTLATDPLTRTTATVANKDATRLALDPLLRQGVRVCIAQFRAGFGTEGDLAAIGIRTPKATRTRIDPPTDSPLIDVASIAPGIVHVRITQVVNGVPVTDRRYPDGVAAVELYARTGAEPYKLRRVVKRVNIAADVSDLIDATKYDWCARYINPRGERGPMSTNVTAPVWNPA